MSTAKWQNIAGSKKIFITHRFIPETLPGQDKKTELKYKIKIRCMKDEAKDDEEDSGLDD